MSVGAVVCASVALLIALVASAGAWLGREKLYQGGVNAAWLGLVGAMGAIWAGQATGGAAALSVAALAATAALPAAGAAAARHRAAASGAAIPLTLAVAALIWAANTTLAPLAGVESPLILAGQLGAMGAGLTLLWCALGRGAGAAALGLIGAAALWGNTRADVAGQGFTLALATDGGPVTFALPAELGGAAVLGLQAAAPAPMLNGLLAGLALMVVAASVCEAGGEQVRGGPAADGARNSPTSKESSEAGGEQVRGGPAADGARNSPTSQLFSAQRERLWLLIGVVAAGAAGALLWAGYSPVMPDLEPYRVWANALGAERKLPEQALAQLGLQHSGKVFVRWVEVLPALSALLALAITALGAGLRGACDDALLARDWLLRAVALVGLSVASGMFVAWRQLGAWGTGAPGEWIALGLMGVGVGGLMMVWRAPDLARRVFAGVWAAMLVAAILAALAFGAPFAVSVRL